MTTATNSKRWPRWARWLRDLAFLGVAVVAIQAWQSRHLLDGVAPELFGYDLDGRAVSLRALQGRPVVVHFWATWCPVCRLEQDSIANLAEDHRVLAVATSSGNADAVRTHLRQDGVMLPVVMDESGEIARAWGVQGVPATFIVDSNGRIGHAGVGYATELGLRARIWFTD